MDQAYISPTVAFGITACNPVLAMIIDVLRCEFRGKSTKVKGFLLLSICSYGAAIAVLSQIAPQHAGHSTGGAGYQISMPTDPTTGRSTASLSMPFHNAYNLHAAPAAGFHSAGCEESPFEFGWVEVNSGKTIWLHANFSVAQLDGNSAIVMLTGHHPSQVLAGGAQLQLNEVRYAWSGQPQCVLYSGHGSYANASALPVSTRLTCKKSDFSCTRPDTLFCLLTVLSLLLCFQAAPFRVAVMSCAETTKACSLDGVGIGADVDAVQCCSKTEECVLYGGCQAKQPSSDEGIKSGR
jgi:hypothetical protein